MTTVMDAVMVIVTDAEMVIVMSMAIVMDAVMTTVMSTVMAILMDPVMDYGNEVMRRIWCFTFCLYIGNGIAVISPTCVANRFWLQTICSVLASFYYLPV